MNINKDDSSVEIEKGEKVTLKLHDGKGYMDLVNVADEGVIAFVGNDGENIALSVENIEVLLKDVINGDYNGKHHG